MNRTIEFTESEGDEIRNLLIGRKVTKVSEDTLQLDDGRLLRFAGNDGCGGCPSGYYELKELNDTDNVITAVDFENEPDGDDYDGEAEGVYRIFVFADNKQINLATFEGSDGNGYYGTGYSIEILPPGSAV